MALKDHIRSARDGLASVLAGWAPPTRRPLSVEPLLAASCLRLGLRLGDVDLANAAAANLVVFDPDRLWLELLAYAATEAGPFDLTPALATLAARKEPIWRRKDGGDWVAVERDAILVGPYDHLGIADELRQTPISRHGHVQV